MSNRTQNVYISIAARSYPLLQNKYTSLLLNQNQTLQNYYKTV